MSNFNSDGTLTHLVRSKGITSWEMLLEYIKNIPYGRNKNREDFSLVLLENKGTCSSKHALAAAVALENKISEVVLIVGLYKMNTQNTPIGTVLSEAGIAYIPEAHCYLKINGIPTDLTSENSSFEKIKNDLLEEIIIQPNQVGDYKVAYHKDFLKKWISETQQKHNFDEIWAIREKCIQKLSES
ncbi:hypothetical protein ABGT15_03440 [Flavobacterium enshiense]|uniref:hypothetical protein n=1 Tax=Flavobacterium enshiense TaxID=1341165 RepID=UPI00345DFB69